MVAAAPVDTAEAAAEAADAALTAASLAARAEEFAKMAGEFCNRLRFASAVLISVEMKMANNNTRIADGHDR